MIMLVRPSGLHGLWLCGAKVAYTQRVPCVPSETFCRPVKNFFFFFFWPSLKQTNYALAARCRQGQG